MNMPLDNLTENEDPNRNVHEDFKTLIKVEIPDNYEQENVANEFNALETEVRKKEKIDLDKCVKQETLLNLNCDIKEELEKDAIKKEENQKDESEESTENAIERQSNPPQDIRRNVELYVNHEIKDELVLGPVVLQPQIIPKEPNDEDTKENFLRDSMEKPDPFTCEVDNKRLTQGNSVLKSYFCHMCGKTYETVKLLKTHVRVHENRNAKKCLLDRHNHRSDKGAHTCHICGNHYKNPITLSRHYRNLHSDKIIKYSCHVCDMKFFDLSFLISHFSAKHQKEFICDICGISMTRRSNLIHHIRAHDKNKRVTCNICGKVFARKTYLRTHQKIHNSKDSPDTIECEKCGKKLKNNKLNYRKHMLYYCVMNENRKKKPISKKPQPVTCDMCGKQYLCKYTLIEHVESKHYNVMYPCKICDKLYTTRYALQRHYLKHKYHNCDICGGLFTTKDCLQKHEIVHNSNNSPGTIECEKCGTKCKYKSSYRKHMLYFCVMNENRKKRPISKKPQPVTCDMCGKQYLRKDYLIKHIKSKHYNLRYRCDICGKQFTQLWTMKSHKLVCSMNA